MLPVGNWLLKREISRMNLFLTYIKDFFSLIYPELCNGCGQSLVTHEKLICTHCIYNLPYTNYHLSEDNKVAKQFWGKVDIQSATAFLYFKKGGIVQNLMHQLKYNKQPEVGFELGKLYGKQLAVNEPYNFAEVIVPVPLHHKRLQKRGYNQSEAFARGLAESMNIPVDCNILIRRKESETQINKSRFKRFENMKEVFEANHPPVAYKNILLVDDTITTGATLEACALALKLNNDIKIQIAGIAFSE